MATCNLTPLALISLGLLAEKPMHPYEMYQTMLTRHDDRNVKVRPGTLYHQVRRLAERGLAEETGTDRDGRRPERTIYTITATGRETLHAETIAMVSEPAEEYPVFNAALGEIHNLPLAEAISALQDRLVALRLEADSHQDGVRMAEERGLPGRFLLDAHYYSAVLDAQIAWIDSLLSRLTGGEIPWDGTRWTSVCSRPTALGAPTGDVASSAPSDTQESV